MVANKTPFSLYNSSFIEAKIDEHGGPKEAKTREVMEDLKVCGLKPFEVEQMVGGKLGAYMCKLLTA